MTRRAGAVLLLGLLAATTPLLHPEAVSAASGVDDYPSRLKNAPKDSLVDPWQFYNRECTSFVAWRLNSENQVAFNDFWQGQHWGNASHWASAANALGIPVDDNPTRGAVAWWSAGSAGSSVGHVAWVETVGDAAITVEEYNYLHSGDYDTRIISKDSSLWPSGFIHIKDTQIRNTASPTVTGTAQVGKKLKATRGTWSGKHLTYSFQWLANGTAIKGATSKTFVPTAGQLGQQIRAKVTATKSGAHSGTARSHATSGVAKGVFVNSSAPAVAGTAQVGIPLAASKGTWTGKGAFAYQWYAAGEPVAGATAATFTPSADELGDALQVRVSVSAPGYKTGHLRSAVTPDVVPGEFTATSPPVVSGVAQVDQPLTATAGAWDPAGRLTYQWLAGGKPISGATGSSYTPTADDVRKEIAIQVTVHLRGYDDAVATSVPTDAVAPGTFLNSEAPSISGTAQVGVPLTADKGSWSPRATIAYQWLVDGQPVPGATGKTYTPAPEDLGEQVTVSVTASRPGYLTSTLLSDHSAAVLPGVMSNLKVPVVAGRAVVGRVLTADNGKWSIRPDSFRYQWYAGHTKIAGATDPTFHPTAAQAGQRIHVVVTARHQGYTSLGATSGRTDRVVMGRVAFAKPTIRGSAVVGHTLTAQLDDVAPSSATAHYHWYRGNSPIHGARDATYVVQVGDLGHKLHVVVTMHATNWVARTRHSASVGAVTTQPRLHPHTSLDQGRVLLRLGIDAPGLDAVDGEAKVWLGHRRVGMFAVTAGHGSRLLAPMKRGTHTLTVVFRGGSLETVGRRSVTITLP
ncbi:MAG TPA: CHAP domain-containing protein [Nocardioides sp.]|uniref:CHAP domain-containing protein n=1 Tax=Nocardioides sp. TaxID=35761 RepID=UPI002E34411E|nr:CHAP domain-containing protein [Nocardioides sp.]HEX3932160.1 CHAP domain-containing protein [Nocardioides sp.]